MFIQLGQTQTRTGPMSQIDLSLDQELLLTEIQHKLLIFFSSDFDTIQSQISISKGINFS